MWNPSPWAVQQGSYANPVTPPTSGPCDAPTVSVCINEQWIPYILGSLFQLAQPSTWNVASQADLADILARVTDLLDAVGTAMPCVSPAPVITGIGGSQRACNMAGYLSNVLIKASIQKAIDNINAGSTILNYGVLIISFIPGAGIVMNTLAQALYRLYGLIEGGTLTDYNDALGDDALWSKITCAIFNATSADGGVTDTNFATLQANVAAVPYAHSDVISAISGFLSDIGSTGLQNLQGIGALAVYDCSSCGTGVSTGPSGLPVRQEAGSVSLTITAGTGSATVAVTFPAPFATIPIVTPNCDDELLIASLDSITTTGMNVTIAAAVNVDVDTTASVSWIAVPPGVA